MSDSSNLATEIVHTENTRNICANLLRILKSSDFKGSDAWQVAQSIDFVQFLHKQADATLKDLKKKMAKADDSKAEAPAALEAEIVEMPKAAEAK